MTDNLKKRLLTVFIGIPALLGVFLLTQHHFVFLTLVVIISSFIATCELSKMIFKRINFAVFLSSLYPVVTYLTIEFNLFESFPYFTLAVEVLVILAVEIFSAAEDNFSSSLSDISSNILILFYPTFLYTFLIKITDLENTKPCTLALFIILVFSNDIFAYVFGMLFGKGNSGIIKASPKKSIAGFIGGTASCMVFSLLLSPVNPFQRLLLGLSISICANIGDLAESVIKRASGVKDSGSIIPGRGGILDCVDSLSAAAPLYYFFCSLF